MNIRDANEKSQLNRDELEKSNICGCYFCVSVFPPSDIISWIEDGQTALCPHCDVDSILPGVSDLDFLASACEEYFTGTAE